MEETKVLGSTVLTLRVMYTEASPAVSSAPASCIVAAAHHTALFSPPAGTRVPECVCIQSTI